MPTLAIDKGFLKDLGKLGRPVYNHVSEAHGFDAAMLEKKLEAPSIMPADGIDQA